LQVLHLKTTELSPAKYFGYHQEELMHDFSEAAHEKRGAYQRERER
jgi:hypothetical protein